MINKERLLRDNRLCKAIIGLSVEELKNLAAEFSACYLIYRKMIGREIFKRETCDKCGSTWDKLDLSGTSQGD